MTYNLIAKQRAKTVISCPINTVYGRTLVLFGLTFSEHAREQPQDASFLLNKLVRTIEDALQESLDAHASWLELCTSGSSDPVVVEIDNVFEPTCIARSQLHGGDGGVGGWPAGGGGGGGGGPLGSEGGAGASGALVFFLYEATNKLLDVEAFVLPGEFRTKVKPGVAYMRVMAWGAGGGGGGGWRTSTIGY